MREPYADIHHYDGSGVDVDEEGDNRYGWYFQIMKTEEQPLSEMIGPYTHQDECEQAAQKEWNGLGY